MKTVQVFVKKNSVDRLRFFVLFFLLFFCFTTCQVDSGSKKTPRPVKIIKAIEGTYYPAVDILFIIDDSTSMDGEQRILARNAEKFINRFLSVEFIDYHIAVTTSSEHNNDSVAADGRLNRCYRLGRRYEWYDYSNYVHKGTYKAAKCLKEMMMVGHSGSAGEHFINIPHLVLSGATFYNFNSDFYRSNAHLAIFVLTDSYDQSDMEPEESYKFLSDLKDGNENKIHYALGTVTVEAGECKRDGVSSSYGPRLERMVSFFVAGVISLIFVNPIMERILPTLPVIWFSRFLLFPLKVCLILHP